MIKRVVFVSVGMIALSGLGAVRAEASHTERKCSDLRLHRDGVCYRSGDFFNNTYVNVQVFDDSTVARRVSSSECQSGPSGCDMGDRDLTYDYGRSTLTYSSSSSSGGGDSEGEYVIVQPTKLVVAAGTYGCGLVPGADASITAKRAPYVAASPSGACE